MSIFRYTVLCRRCGRIFKAEHYDAEFCVECEDTTKESLSTKNGLAASLEAIPARHNIADTVFCFCGRCKKLFLSCDPAFHCYRCKVEMLKISLLGALANRKRGNPEDPRTEENQLCLDFGKERIRSDGK